MVGNLGQCLFQGFLDCGGRGGFLALPAVETGTIVFDAERCPACRFTHWCIGHYVSCVGSRRIRLAPLLQQFLGLGSLVFTALSNDLIEDFPGTVKIAHRLVGNGEVQLG